MNEGTPKAAPDGVAMNLLPCPYQSLDANGCFVAVNEAWLRLLGYRAEEVVGKPFADFLAGPYAVLFAQRFREFKKVGEVSGVRFDLRTGRGSCVPCRFEGRIEYGADGEMVRTHCILHEADEQVRLAESLRRSENKLHATLGTAQEGVLLLDAQQRITRANPAAAELLGRKAGDLAGHALVELVAETSRDQALNLLARADETDEARTGCDLPFRHSDGHLVTARVRAKHVRDEPHSLLATIVSLADVGRLARVEEERQENRDLALGLLDSAWDGILVLDPENRLAHANRRAAEMHGSNLTAMLSMPSASFMTEEERIRLAEMQAADDGAEQSARFVLRRPDGTFFPVEASGCIMPIRGQRHFLYVLRDVSEEERARTDRHEDQAFRQLLMQHTSDGVAIYEAADEGPDFRILDLNPAACRQSGKNRGELVGRCLREALPNLVEEGWLAGLRNVWRTGEATSIPLPEGDASPRTESRLLPLPGGRILAIFQDRTALHNAEARLRAGEAHLRRLLENMPVLIAAFNADGTPLVWNKECERVSGYSAAEVVGNPLAFAWMYPDPEVRRRRLELQSPGAAGFRNLEWALRCKDGSYRTLLISNLANEFPVPGWASWAVGVDITPYRATERQLNTRREELEKRVRERTEELRTMVAAMAGRESRMVELKEVIAALREQLRQAGLVPMAYDPLAAEGDSP